MSCVKVAGFFVLVFEKRGFSAFFRLIEKVEIRVKEGVLRDELSMPLRGITEVSLRYH